MIKKALLPIALILAIVLLAWKFFTVTEPNEEQLDPFLVLPSDAIVVDIQKETETQFLEHGIVSESRFICKTFPDEIASCKVLSDSLFLDSNSFIGSIKIDNIYSSDTIYSFKKEFFFVDGKKIYSTTNAVLIKQLLLKTQKKDLLKLDANMIELKALTQESKNVLVSWANNNSFILEYSDINESATAYSFSEPIDSYISSEALRFVPPNASHFDMAPNQLKFLWENIPFTISATDSAFACEKKYRDAKICKTDSLIIAYINGLKIISPNESASNNLLDVFYENKGFQNIKNNQNINWIKQVSTFDSPTLLLMPKFIKEGNFLSYASSKDLKIWHLLSRNESVQRSNVDVGEFEINFPSEIIYGPYAVKNHRSKTQCLMVQTADNLLYYLNSKGKILWKTSIDGKILGKPIEVDRFRNKKVQYVFNTKNKLYQIDILGRSVSGFPKKLKSSAPVILVKYKARKERILVPVGKRIKNYLLDGKKTKGWSEVNLDGNIKNLDYRKIKSLDCILVTTNKKTYLLNPRGQKRNHSKNLKFENSICKIATKSAHINTFHLDQNGYLFIGNTKANKAEQFSKDVFHSLVDLDNFIYAVGDMQLVLLTQDGDLVENKFLNEKPWIANNAVEFNDGEFYSLFIAPGVRCTLKSPNKAFSIVSLGQKVVFSENKTLHFVDRL
jgi:hypothetical protein